MKRQKKRRLQKKGVTAAHPDPNTLDTPLLALSPEDTLPIRSACEGGQVFEASGSGAAIAEAFLRAGIGGLVMYTKVDDSD